MTVIFAQDLSRVKVLDDSLFLDDEVYVNGNAYQRDALLFVDMLADTHPIMCQKARREQLLAGRDALLKACAVCESDSAFVELLAETLGDLCDKHTDLC